MPCSDFVNWLFEVELYFGYLHQCEHHHAYCFNGFAYPLFQSHVSSHRALLSLFQSHVSTHLSILNCSCDCCSELSPSLVKRHSSVSQPGIALVIVDVSLSPSLVKHPFEEDPDPTPIRPIPQTPTPHDNDPTPTRPQHDPDPTPTRPRPQTPTPHDTDPTPNSIPT